jgi:nitrite reductase/ring-hydroxylating ferredoxin subunit
VPGFHLFCANLGGGDMAEFVRVCSRSELPQQGQAREFEVNGRTICVANVSGRIAAMDNVCVHRGGPLGQGSVERGKVVCPWHGWEFEPFTGAAVHNEQHRVAVYEVRIEGEVVMIALFQPGSIG